MSAWPNRGASGGPCGGLRERQFPPNLEQTATV